MPNLKNIVSQLRRQEASLAKQLAGLRNAISSLEFGGWAVPSEQVRTARKNAKRARDGRPRRLSAATRAKMRAAQRARWAKVRAKNKAAKD